MITMMKTENHPTQHQTTIISKANAFLQFWLCAESMLIMPRTFRQTSKMVCKPCLIGLSTPKSPPIRCPTADCAIPASSIDLCFLHVATRKHTETPPNSQKVRLALSPIVEDENLHFYYFSEAEAAAQISPFVRHPYLWITIPKFNNPNLMSQTTHHSFEGKQKQYDVAFDLTATSSAVEDSLRIRVKNTQTFVVFGELIDQKYVNQSEALNCFPGPSDVYDHLIQHFPKMECCRCCPQMATVCGQCGDCGGAVLGPNDVVVGDGTLTFPYRWGETVDRQRRVTIVLPNLNLDEGQTAHLRIDQLHTELHCVQKALSDSNAELKAAIEQNSAAIGKTNDDLSATKDDHSKTNAELSKTNDSLQQTNDRLASTDQRLEQTNADLQQTNAVLSKTNEQLSKTQTDLSNTNQNVQNNTTAIEQTNKALEQTNTALDQVKKDISSIDQKADSTKQTIEQINSGIQATNNALPATSQKLRARQADLQSLNNDLRTTKDQLSTTTNNLNESNRVLSQKQAQMRNLENKMNQLQRRVEQLENHPCGGANSYNSIYHHHESVDKGLFQLTNHSLTSASIKIPTKPVQLYQVFVNGFEIHLGKRAKYRVTPKNLHTDHFLIGFVSNPSRIGSEANSHMSSEGIFYNTIGQVISGGQLALANTGSYNVNDTVEAHADLVKEKVIFWKNGVQIGPEFDLPTNMRNKPIFFAVLLREAHDQADLWAL